MRAVALGVGSAMLMMGCLVTDKIEVEQEQNLPPSIFVPAGAPFSTDRVITIDVDAPTSDDGGAGSSELRFEVEIRDPNVTDRLTAQVVTDRRLVTTDAAAGDIPPTGSQTRPFSFTVNPVHFLGPAETDPLDAVGCHRVELWVSQRFFATRVPTDPADAAVMVWWVRAVRDPFVDVIDMGRCF